METLKDYAARTLGVRIPDDYARFMEQYATKLPDDPIREESWVAGLGNEEFVIGTTLAFRSALPNFPRSNVVIGYLGLKRIVVNRTYEDIDQFSVLNTLDGKVLSVDSRGVTEVVADSFEEWIAPELLRAKLRDKYTTKLAVLVFDDESKAEEARTKLLKLQKEGFLDLEDAVVVVKDADGTVRHHPMHKLTRKGIALGSITGLLVGVLLLNPLLGVVVGAVTAGMSAALNDAGIEDSFVKELSRKFQPGNSALFALVRKADPERVRQEFLGFGGKVLVTSVSREKEESLQTLLDKAREQST